MPITLHDLARSLGLPVLAGDVSKPVAWVHGTELADPTPFLEGGELLLTTGLAGTGPGYVRRLVRAGVVGLGFGTGLGHDVVPARLVAAAAEAGLGLVEVPREVPFIAISKAVSKALAADEYAALTRTSEAQRALTGAAVRAGTAGVVRRLGRWVGGWVVLLDAAGEPVHAHNPRLVPDLTAGVARLRTAGGLASAAFEAGGDHVFLQVLGSRARGVLAVGTSTPLDAADVGIVNTAASLLTLALARNDAVDAARRELRSGQFRLLLAGLGVDGLPERFRVFLAEEPPATGFWAEHDGRIVVLAQESDGFASSEVDASEVARGYREARQAQQAGVRRFEDLAGNVRLPDGFAEALLRPLDAETRETVRVWLAHHGAWDPAAARLGVHRHTVRNRVRKAEEALGRSLDSPGLRAELWLALHREGQ
ncbi:purine catabolism regulatory protein [Lentzea xinjiangensis]|uniref:Purine catabolism regulatory protein n=1 Tax=Lentzea xinjiangensis TaxID=402600 RepID=A0A1H9QUH2_9PSEU|nr:PucR family transcriptional regulator [Lentzea xinjiangensis]SER64098.1 purine catabolism regulatory protein [Lentzea xinjiangensis]